MAPNIIMLLISILASYLWYWCKYLLVLLYAHSLFFRTGTFKMVTYFKEEWLSDPLFEKWWVKDADKKSAKCKTCQVQFNLSNMGHRAVASHMEGKKHIQKSKPVSYFINPSQSTSIKQADLVVDQLGKTCAEIYFVLHAVQNNLSLNSFNDNGQLYQKVFLDSKTPKSYKMGRAKLVYVVSLVFDLTYVDF